MFCRPKPPVAKPVVVLGAHEPFWASAEEAFGEAGITLRVRPVRNGVQPPNGGAAVHCRRELVQVGQAAQSRRSTWG